MSGYIYRVLGESCENHNSISPNNEDDVPLIAMWSHRGETETEADSTQSKSVECTHNPKAVKKELLTRLYEHNHRAYVVIQA